VLATTIPWGDVSTAFYSTGIPDIEVYMAVESKTYWAMVASRYLGLVVGLRRYTELSETSDNSGSARTN
jgi:short subunit dehydrogenase-like uncharacterized protein